jgi:hypothetical protein
MGWSSLSPENLELSGQVLHDANRRECEPRNGETLHGARSDPNSPIHSSCSTKSVASTCKDSSTTCAWSGSANPAYNRIRCRKPEHGKPHDACRVLAVRVDNLPKWVYRVVECLLESLLDACRSSKGRWISSSFARLRWDAIMATASPSRFSTHLVGRSSWITDRSIPHFSGWSRRDGYVPSGECRRIIAAPASTN